MNWWRSLIIIVCAVTLTTFTLTAALTGRDIPGNLAGLIGTALGLTLGSAAVDKLGRAKPKDDHD